VSVLLSESSNDNKNNQKITLPLINYIMQDKNGNVTWMGVCNRPL